jgi:predicted TIM-barrel fold metal-dependent hydrolase
MLKRLPLALAVLGILLLAWGISLDQSVVGKYRFFAVTAGYTLVAVAAMLAVRRMTIVLLGSIVVGYLLVAYAFYVRARFPDNLLFRPSRYVALVQILMGNTIPLTEYEPRSSLTVKHHDLIRAKYPAIDIHFHLDSLVNITADTLVRAMDATGIAKVVNMDGLPRDFDRFKRDFHDKYPDRIVMFARIALEQLFATPDGIDQQIAMLEKAVRSGAAGVKVTKGLGLGTRDSSGSLVRIDDARLDPIWTKAGELGIPVLIHSGDPTAFSEPVDRFNERYDELKDHPDWSINGPQFPTKKDVLSQRDNLIARHPGTIFIGAHLGMSPEDLSYASELLSKYPNYYVDIASTLHELGRQPFTAREFFIKHQDRILFGTDSGFGVDRPEWPLERSYRTYVRFLETHDEYFEYPLWGIQNQGRWRIYGIDLPDDVLEKVYYQNAARILRLGQ